MVRIVHDAGGVRGLIVVLDFFSEAVEKRLFELGNKGIFHAAKRSMAGLNIAGERMPRFPDDIFRLANAVRDCGAFPELITPNHVHYINYPKGGSSAFKEHFDGRARWGETVVGVSTGHGAVIYFKPHKPHLKVAGGCATWSRPAGRFSCG